MFCTQCGVKVDELAKVCPRCGSAAAETELVEASAETVGSARPADPQNRRPKKLPKLIVGMLAIAFFSALFLIHQYNDERERKASATTVVSGDANTTPDSMPLAVSIPLLRFVSSGGCRQDSTSFDSVCRSRKLWARCQIVTERITSLRRRSPTEVYGSTPQMGFWLFVLSRGAGWWR